MFLNLKNNDLEISLCIVIQGSINSALDIFFRKKLKNYEGWNKTVVDGVIVKDIWL